MNNPARKRQWQNISAASEYGQIELAVLQTGHTNSKIAKVAFLGKAAAK
ncbi:MAG: hypothetical protein WCA64_11335 [Gallionella sp.]